MRVLTLLVLVIWGTAGWGQQPPLIRAAAATGAPTEVFLQRAYDQAARYLATRHGLRLNRPIVIYGTDAPATMQAGLNAALEDAGLPTRDHSFDTETLCANKRLGAAANRHFVVLCWDGTREDAASLSPGFAAFLTPILTHELTHHMQYQLANDVPARRLPDASDIVLGPSWMVEGIAELIETDFQTPIATFQGKDIFNLQSRARRSRVTLGALHQSGSVRSGAAYGVSRFACLMLARKHGISALFSYFETLGETQDRARAFREVFGQDMAAFEAEFETLRRDYGAARDYGQDGS